MDATITREEMFETNLPLAKKIANRFWVRYRHFVDIEFEDCLSWATIGLIKAVENYIPTANNTFGTYAYRCIECQVISGIEAFQGIKRSDSKRRNETMSFQSRMRQFGETFIPKCDDRGHKSVDDREESEYLLSSLNERHRECLRLIYLEGIGYEEAGRRLGVSRQRVFQIRDFALRLIRESLKSAGGEFSKDSLIQP